jgi:Mn2+/Fe2+ NRAMP family transporter
LHLFNLNPLKALVWAAIINGVAAVPIMALLMLMSTQRRIMGSFLIGQGWWVVGWLATGIMGAACVVMLILPG